MCTDTRLFCLCQLFPSEEVEHECAAASFACVDPGAATHAGTWTASAPGIMALSESFLEPLVAGNQKSSLASFLCSPTVQALRGLTFWGPSLIFGTSGT